MAKVKIVQIAVALASDSVNGGEERQLFLDDKGRVWYPHAVPDEDKCEYDELGRRTKSVYKDAWSQLELPDEPNV